MPMLSNEDVLNQEVTPAPATSRQRIVTANSIVLFLLAYLLCYLAAQFATIAAAFSARIPTVFHPGHLEFKIPDAAWRTADVITVYAAGPGVALGLAFTGAVLFILFRHTRGLQKTFFLWTFLHGFNLFFGALIAGTITQSGFWYAIRWGGFNDTALWIMVFISLVILLIIGVLAAPAFLLSCDSISLMEYQNRGKMLAATVIWPWLLGSLLLVLLKLPDVQLYENLQIFSLLLILIPVYFLNQQNLYSETVEMPKRIRLSQTALALFILIAVVFRLLVQSGRLIG